MSYQVKEIFYSLQGEGVMAGSPAVFVRFAGCNLWTGREEDRSGAQCRFCDTDFVGTDGPSGGVFKTARELADVVVSFWPDEADVDPFVVCTGGEPLLQLDKPLLRAFHERGMEVALETNGTIGVLDDIDWVCVSPKAGVALEQKAGDELKLVYPQEGVDPADYASLFFNAFFLQPLDDENLKENTQLAVEYCLAHPEWRLSLQMHKMLGIK